MQKLNIVREENGKLVRKIKDLEAKIRD